MKIHDPHHVAHLAAVILSSRPEPEAHHIKAAVVAARSVLDEAHRAAEEDAAAVDGEESGAAVGTEKAEAAG